MAHACACVLPKHPRAHELVGDGGEEARDHTHTGLLKWKPSIILSPHYLRSFQTLASRAPEPQPPRGHGEEGATSAVLAGTTTRPWVTFRRPAL
jgi:hypothetical protein